MKTDPNDWKRRSYFSLVALRGPRQSPKDINMDISILLYVWCMASMTICCVFACSHECACKSRQVLNSLKLSLFFLFFLQPSATPQVLSRRDENVCHDTQLYNSSRLASPLWLFTIIFNCGHSKKLYTRLPLVVVGHTVQPSLFKAYWILYKHRVSLLSCRPWTDILCVQ